MSSLLKVIPHHLNAYSCSPSLSKLSWTQELWDCLICVKSYLPKVVIRQISLPCLVYISWSQHYRNVGQTYNWILSIWTRSFGNQQGLLQLVSQGTGILCRRQKQWHFVELVLASGLDCIFIMKTWNSAVVSWRCGNSAWDVVCFSRVEVPFSMRAIGSEWLNQMKCVMSLGWYN